MQKPFRICSIIDLVKALVELFAGLALVLVGSLMLAAAGTQEERLPAAGIVLIGAILLAISFCSFYWLSSFKKEMRRKADLEGFRLPTYTEIPDVGLFLDQVSKYISMSLYPLGNITCTSSMISNYVKKGLVRNPVRKQYDRSQIAALFLISIFNTPSYQSFSAAQPRNHARFS